VRDVRKYEVFRRADQIHLASALGYAPAETAGKLDADYEEVKKMLAGLLARVTGRSPKP